MSSCLTGMYGDAKFKSLNLLKFNHSSPNTGNDEAFERLVI